MGEALLTLKKYFGYSSFRSGQEELIESILSSADTLGIMPTGAGKSLCYQIPALMLKGTTIVVSPLISLMKDQVDSLNEYSIPATYINSSLDWRELKHQIYLASKGQFKLIYIAPERLESENFLLSLKNISISLIAIDEAHCVSHWGHDFRPSYLSIANLINSFPTRPRVAAFTATATNQVKDDIIKQLEFKSPNVFITGFDRENLFFSINRNTDKMHFIIDYVEENKDQSGIIYAATRKEVDRLHDLLIRKGYLVGKYHAGLTDEERNKVQDQFSYDQLKIIVATNAFGLGIDKSNVRFVIHHNMPKNIEAYYQEAGRAGRDGDPAECILLFGGRDIHIQKFLIENSQLSPDRKTAEYIKLQKMIDYCYTNNCLKKHILEYFDQKNVSEYCDSCINCKGEKELHDVTIDAQKVLSCIKRMGEQYGINLLIGVLRGSKISRILDLRFDKLSTYGIMKNYSANELRNFINFLISSEYLYMTEGQYPILRSSEKAILVLRGNKQVMQKLPKKPKQVEVTLDKSLFDLLKQERKKISDERQVPPYIIFTDSTLRQMSIKYPADRRTMLAISGVGESKYQGYGQRFINIIQNFCNDNFITLEDSVFSYDTRETNKVLSKKSSGGILSDTYLTTYKMHKAQQSLAEIAITRDVTVRTIEDHIIKCGNSELDIEWNYFFSQEEEALVLNAIKEVGTERLKPIKEALPKEISYFQISGVICKHKLMSPILSSIV